MKNNHRKDSSHKKYLLPASKLPPQPIKDFRESTQWRIFRIMAEFVEGFNFLADMKKSVTFFGSARTKPTDPDYKKAQKLAFMLGQAGYTMVTGGGPGIMEAANLGAYEAKAPSVGFNIQLPEEQRINPFVTQSIAFHYFFTRKLMLSYSAQAYVFFQGGYGTLDEFFEIVTLIQTRKIDKITIVAFGKQFWNSLYKFLKDDVYRKYDSIDKEDLNLFQIVDTPEEAFEIITKSKPRKIEI